MHKLLRCLEIVMYLRLPRGRPGFMRQSRSFHLNGASGMAPAWSRLLAGSASTVVQRTATDQLSSIECSLDLEWKIQKQCSELFKQIVQRLRSLSMASPNRPPADIVSTNSFSGIQEEAGCKSAHFNQFHSRPPPTPPPPAVSQINIWLASFSNFASIVY